MSQLDHERTLARLDPLNLNHAVEHLPEQFRIGWEEGDLIGWPRAYGTPKELILCGPSLSTLAAQLALASLSEHLTIPATFVKQSQLPRGLKKDGLVIIISLNGGESELLTIYKQALDQKLKVAVIAPSSPLLELATKHRQPHITFNPDDYAPSSHTTGFFVGAFLRLLTKAKLVNFKTSQLETGLTALHEVIDTCAPDILTPDNPAKQISAALEGQQVLIVGAEHLLPSAQILVYYLNRTAKQQAQALELADFTGHTLESFVSPAAITAKTAIILLKSKLYHPLTSDHFHHVADILEDMGLNVVEYDCGLGGLFAEISELLALSYYVSWYAAVLNGCETGDDPHLQTFQKACKQKSSR